jgi:GH18 family chitinase
MKLIAFLLFASLASATSSASRPVAIGYLPAFKGLAAGASRVDFSSYTHVNLAFANPDSRGRIAHRSELSCAPDGEAGMVTRKAVRQLARKLHRTGTKLLLSLGGGVIPSCAGDWAKLVEPGSRERLVIELVRFVVDERLDGIDVDLEGELMTRIERAGNYTPFVSALGQALRARGKLLTCATATYEGGMVPDSSLPHFDLIGIMSYDAIGPSWGSPGDAHSTTEQAQKDLAYWTGKVPANRLALGLPFYGYGFGRFRSTYALRDIAKEFGEEALNRDLIGQACAGCNYVTYNGLSTLHQKAALAGATGAGIMVWEITQDLPANRAIQTALSGLHEGISARRP